MEQKPKYIIAIGASAGGMEEINSFFDHTPMDGVSYVIVQHLSPDFKSRMAELLARHSKLVVMEAKNEMTVQSNQVYLIPNDKFMTIHESKLYLTDKQKVQGPHLTINRFFSSLAADSGRKAIGIILSGLGSDGSEGVKEIKKAGGMVIARNPETSEFSSMPSHAIATGVVDFVLEPESMPDAIEDYVKHEGETIIDDLDDANNVSKILEIINSQLPFDFTEYKQTTLLRRIQKRAGSKGFSNLPSYIEFLRSTPDEVESVAKEFLISVTSFFRDKEAFKFIQQNVIGDLLAKLEPGEELKLWVAGCATGEEAFSLAILIFEHLGEKYNETIVKIFATDIDVAALANARSGLYKETIANDVSPERLEKYFIREGDQYRLIPEIRSMVIFAQHDLIKNPPYCNMHFISCRNLLIYMTPALQRKVFLLLLFGLKHQGYLFLGTSENPTPITQNLEVVDKKWKVYRNIETTRVVRFDAFSLPDVLDSKRSSLGLRKNESSNPLTAVLTEAVTANLTHDMNCLVICVDETNNVVKSFGDTSKYLLQKNFNLNLEELLPRPLAVAFKAVFSSALKSDTKVSSSGIRIQREDEVATIRISVKPLHIKKGTRKLLMVTFDEIITETVKVGKESNLSEAEYFNQFTVNLEEEVKELKILLHEAYEKLDASNENMQSFNEELLSSNEEMQSTNEEMQSVNEELHTINTDHQLKNKELLELNDDLNNYFRSNINGQLFVNTDLILKKFSPGTVKLINLLETDIGRPISNISTNIKFETIINDIKDVLKNAGIITKEIETTDGKWYQMMTMPYLQIVDNKITGVIITFNDITHLKKIQEELDKKNQMLLRLNSDLDNFAHTASHDLLAPLANIEISIAVMNEIQVKDSKLKLFLDVINSSIKKFRALISEISTVSKLEGNSISTELVDLNEVINNVEWSLGEKIKESSAEIIRELEVTHIEFSKKNVRSIFYNLISNAVKFRSSESPKIKVTTVKNNDTIILTVTDNGIGIAEHDQHQIFRMHARLNNDVDGQGIGLYLVKKIVDTAGGRIVVESQLDKGSKFMVYFN